MGKKRQNRKSKVPPVSEGASFLREASGRISLRVFWGESRTWRCRVRWGCGSGAGPEGGSAPSHRAARPCSPETRGASRAAGALGAGVPRGCGPGAGRLGATRARCGLGFGRAGPRPGAARCPRVRVRGVPGAGAGKRPGGAARYWPRAVSGVAGVSPPASSAQPLDAELGGQRGSLAMDVPGNQPAPARRDPRVNCSRACILMGTTASLRLGVRRARQRGCRNRVVWG